MAQSLNAEATTCGFDVNHCVNGEITNDGKTVTKTSYGYGNTCYGSYIYDPLSNKQIEYKIKITPLNPGVVYIGMDYANCPNINDSFPRSYAICPTHWMRQKYGNASKSPYLEKNGQIFLMILKQHSLTFYDETTTVIMNAFRLKKNHKYRLAAEVYTKGNSISILNFSEKEIPQHIEIQHDISEKIAALTVKIDKLQQTVNGMQSRLSILEEEKKKDDDDKLDNILKEIETIKQCINVDMNPKRSKLKLWLENDVELPEYYDLFLENGIEDLSTALLLTMDTIKGIGIDKIGHQMKISHQVLQLKQNISNNKVEGSTAYI